MALCLQSPSETRSPDFNGDAEDVDADGGDEDVDDDDGDEEDDKDVDDDHQLKRSFATSSKATSPFTTMRWWPVF